MAMIEAMSQPHGNSTPLPTSDAFRRPKKLNDAMPPFSVSFWDRHRRSASPVAPPDGTNRIPDHPDRSDRPGRRRPFSTLMRKLANLKAGDGHRPTSSKRNNVKTNNVKGPSKKEPTNNHNNNPYPLSGRIRSNTEPHNRGHSLSSRGTRISSATSLRRDASSRSSIDERPPPTAAGTRSMAPTVSTDHETSRSITAASHGDSSLAGTSRTANGGLDSRRGGDSTFSSPAPSVRSLTTTLTTIQSMAANGATNGNANNNPHNNINGGGAPAGSAGHQTHQPSGSQVIHFNQPFPTASPASAIPSHLTPSSSSTPGHPTTYSTATANNLLTDNASILTLASSSRRRRRRSLDTDASVRALAPSSLFGGSRESLPLSVLSANIDGGGSGGGPPTTPGLHRGANERTSIYSATGILASERNSFYAKPNIAASGSASGGGAGAGAGGGTGSGSAGATDGASIRSGLLGHGRAESVSGSIGGMATSPLASPMETAGEEGHGEEVEYKEVEYKSNGKDSGCEWEGKDEQV